MSLILSGTDGLSDVDGSAATPAIRGTDANTGIFFPAADQVAITTGGTQRAVVDASGNVGIGTASPTALLDVYKAAQGGTSTFRAYGPAGQILWANSGASTSYLDSDTTIFRQSSASGNTERMRISSDGYVTMSNQPSFWAYTTSGATTFTSTTIIFNSAPTNRGSCYNTANGRFTAPVAGFYVFGGMLQNNSSTGYLEVEFRVNGAKQLDTQVAQVTYGQKAVMSAAYYLNSGDYVTYYVFNGTVMGDYTSAWGYLVG